MMKSIWLIILCFNYSQSVEHDFKGFDDSILFNINWPGIPEISENTIDSEVNKSQNRESLKVTTFNKEKYECYLPQIEAKNQNVNEEYNGPTALTLLKPLISQKICSYRLESYWSYEVCHGRYIRQYHEERDGKHLKVQEYFLGYWNSEKTAKLEEEVKAAQDNKVKLKTTKVELLNLPYVEMVMDDGTLCDLNGKSRVTRVLYVCYNHGKHEVYSFKETSTCEYEIIILSPLLCDHPQFKPHEVKEHSIDCMPLDGAPKKPRSLLRMEADSLRLQHQSTRLINSDKYTKDVQVVLKVEKVDKDGEPHLKVEFHPLGDDDDLTEVTSKSVPALDTSMGITDDSPVRAFLNGDNCLNGGTGWWKYEFCYGKHVIQYHIDRTGEKTTVLLGQFDLQGHLDWIKENKGKAPKPVEHRTSISHFYSNGDICDKTGKPRQTEVKLKCLENSSNSAQVSLYLLEPRTCHYILGVESPLICEILPLADENGIVKSTKNLNAENTADNKIQDEDDSNVVLNFGND